MLRLAVVILVDRRGWLLLQERDEDAPRAANQWGLVGGHVEDGEEFEPAAYRELEEETGLVLEPGRLTLWREERFRYSDAEEAFHFHVYTAQVDLADEDIVVGEGKQIVFVSPDDVHHLDRSESCAHFTEQFLASADHHRLLATAREA